MFNIKEYKICKLYIIKVRTPRLNKSADTLNAYPLIISGAMYPGVPHFRWI